MANTEREREREGDGLIGQEEGEREKGYREADDDDDDAQKSSSSEKSEPLAVSVPASVAFCLDMTPALE